MATSVRETIVARIAETVATVTLATGFDNDIQRVYRTFHTPTLEDELPYACVFTQSEDDDVGVPLQHYRVDLHIGIWVFTCFDVADDDEADVNLNSAIADIKKAILQDDQLKGGQTPGTRVDRLEITGTRRGLFGQSASWSDGAEISLLVQYIYSATDPYSGR